MSALSHTDALYFHSQPSVLHVLNAVLPTGDPTAVDIASVLPPGAPWFDLVIGAQAFDYQIRIGTMEGGATEPLTVPAGQMFELKRIVASTSMDLVVASAPQTVALLVSHPAMPGF